MVKIGYICPTYQAGNFHEYTTEALRSFWRTTPGGVALLVDDATSDWQQWEAHYRKMARDEGQGLECIHFGKKGGLTRSWNAGLARAYELDLDYVIASNNDIIFPSDRWHAGLLHALTNGYAMAGPVSNAPGTTAGGAQEVERYVPNYQLSGQPEQLQRVAETLYAERLGHVIESNINGFFQIASMQAWRKGMFDHQHYYRPLNTHTRRGKRNPTPTMTLNEDELQARWQKQGQHSAVALSSFIFHYRAVSRGNRYKRGNWYRKR